MRASSVVGSACASTVRSDFWAFSLNFGVGPFLTASYVPSRSYCLFFVTEEVQILISYESVKATKRGLICLLFGPNKNENTFCCLLQDLEYKSNLFESNEIKNLSKF